MAIKGLLIKTLLLIPPESTSESAESVGKERANKGTLVGQKRFTILNIFVDSPESTESAEPVSKPERFVDKGKAYCYTADSKHSGWPERFTMTCMLIPQNRHKIYFEKLAMKWSHNIFPKAE